MSEGQVWREPVRGGYPDPGMLALPGRERLQTWLRSGSASPPLTRLTGARPAAVGDGTADAEMPATDWLLNSAGLIGGGTLAILADIALGCAVETKLPAATPYTTAELSLTFLRPARPGATLSAHGQAIHVGRSMGLSEAFLIDPRGESLIAHGTSRLAILPQLDDVPDRPEARAPDRPAADAPDRNQPAADNPDPDRPTAETLEPDRPTADTPDPDRPTAEAPHRDRPAADTPDPYRRPAPADAVLEQSVWDELPGREVLARQIAGDLPPPPIHRLCGLSLAEAGDGEATMRIPATEWLNRPTGRLQGGAIAMLADAALASAALTTAEAGTAVAGLDLKVNYLRPALADGRDLTARAEVAHSGRSLAISRARVDNAKGKPVALATGTAMYLPGRPARLDTDVELSAR